MEIKWYDNPLLLDRYPLNVLYQIHPEHFKNYTFSLPSNSFQPNLIEHWTHLTAYFASIDYEIPWLFNIFKVSWW
jgi:hypothetical protein